MGMVPALAQEPKPAAEPGAPEPMSVEDRIRRKVDFMDARLNLTDKQEDAILDLYLDFANTPMTCQQREEAREELRGKVDQILTEEQREIRNAPHHGPRHHAAHPGKGYRGKSCCDWECDAPGPRHSSCCTPGKEIERPVKGPVPPRRGER